MNKIISILLLACLPIFLQAQLVCTLKDKQLCESHLEGIQQTPMPPSMGDMAIAIGQRFLGTPYVAKTLELGMEEDLVVNLQGLDCTTFLENVVVMSRLWKKNALHFEAFQKELEFLRYRDGKRAGYPSRLHYFTEWLTNNEKKGIIKNITAELGGKPIDKQINFMSTHRSAYMQLKGEENYQAIQAVEKANEELDPCYIPKEEIREKEQLIKDGDLIALSTNIKGLDVVHVGIAIHQNGRLHLLHASTGSNKVEISAKPLAEYMSTKRVQNGIMVARLM
ncbi:MAG: N-acetylmuramoyl-L-alanine amidase-like domain-containing protein [Bacteroidota bacterium]